MREPFGKIDSREVYSEIKVPQVILLKKGLTEKKYVGFVPGLTKQDVIEESLEKCKSRLLEQTKTQIIEMAKNKNPFPFFPTKEGILEDFDNVYYVSFIKIKQSLKN